MAVWYGEEWDVPGWGYPETGEVLPYSPAEIQARGQAEIAAIRAAPSYDGIGDGEMISPTPALPVSYVLPATPAVYDGIATAEIMTSGLSTSIAAPLVAAGAAVATMAIGVIKALLLKYGAVFVKGLIGVAAFKTFLDLIRGGASDDTQIPIKAKRKASRYSIGTNPRLRTLLKVAKRVDNIFAQYDTRITKFRSRLRGYHPRRRGYAPMGQYLSPVERRSLRRRGG